MKFFERRNKKLFKNLAFYLLIIIVIYIIVSVVFDIKTKPMVISFKEGYTSLSTTYKDAKIKLNKKNENVMSEFKMLIEDYDAEVDDKLFSKKGGTNNSSTDDNKKIIKKIEKRLENNFGSIYNTFKKIYERDPDTEYARYKKRNKNVKKSEDSKLYSGMVKKLKNFAKEAGCCDDEK